MLIQIYDNIQTKLINLLIPWKVLQILSIFLERIVVGINDTEWTWIAPARILFKLFTLWNRLFSIQKYLQHIRIVINVSILSGLLISVQPQFHLAALGGSIRLRKPGLLKAVKISGFSSWRIIACSLQIWIRFSQ